MKQGQKDGCFLLLIVWVAPTIATSVGLSRGLPSHSKYVFFLFFWLLLHNVLLLLMIY